MNFTLMAVLLLMLAPGVRAIEPDSSGAPPNIVLIISDDQHYADYGFMHHPHVRTPSIDRLASESLVFTNGRVTTSLCCPSLATIITGLYPKHHRITGNEPPKGPDRIRQREQMDAFINDVPTLPRLLTARGYLSLQTGKWWHGNYQRGGFTHGMTHGDPTRSGRHGDEGLTIGRRGLEPIARFIETAASEDAPFFIWYAPFMPHTPHTPPQRLLEKYVGVAPSQAVAKYWAMCEWFDETVGELRILLQEEDCADNTIVVYLCDNGWITAPNGRFAPRSKRSPYDGGLRTPIMIHWPDHVKPGTSDFAALNVDVTSTVLAAIGLNTPLQFDGIDLLDDTARRSRTAAVGTVYLHDARDIQDPEANWTHRWCVEGRWKLIMPNRDIGSADPDAVRLYDIQADPTELENLAEAHPEVVRRLAEVIRSHHGGP